MFCCLHRDFCSSLACVLSLWLKPLFYGWYVFFFVDFCIAYFISLTRKTLWEVKVFETLPIWKWAFYTFIWGYLDIEFQVRKNFPLVFLMSSFHYLLASNILLKSSVSIWFIILCVKPTFLLSPLCVQKLPVVEDFSYSLCWTCNVKSYSVLLLWQPLPTNTTILLMIYF